MSDTSQDSLVFVLIDSTFSELLSMVGHSQAEIDAALPSFRHQFLTQFFFAASTFLPEKEMEAYIERLKKADVAVLNEVNAKLSKEQWLGSLLYAFEEVYGGYGKAINPALSDEQRTYIQSKFQNTYLQEPNE